VVKSSRVTLWPRRSRVEHDDGWCAPPGVGRNRARTEFLVGGTSSDESMGNDQDFVPDGHHCSLVAAVAHDAAMVLQAFVSPGPSAMASPVTQPELRARRAMRRSARLRLAREPVTDPETVTHVAGLSATYLPGCSIGHLLCLSESYSDACHLNFRPCCSGEHGTPLRSS
jgi:hypothetical protein